MRLVIGLTIRSSSASRCPCPCGVGKLHNTWFKNSTIVGLHGHTVAHCLMNGLQSRSATARLAEKTGFDVVFDFRRRMWRPADKAPLRRCITRRLAGSWTVPQYRKYRRWANVTWVDPAGDVPPVAFDTGPGNALLDDWVEHYRYAL